MESKQEVGNGVTEHTDLINLAGFSESERDWASILFLSTARTEMIEPIIIENRRMKEMMIPSFLLFLEV